MREQKTFKTFLILLLVFPFFGFGGSQNQNKPKKIPHIVPRARILRIDQYGYMDPPDARCVLTVLILEIHREFLWLGSERLYPRF